MIKEEKYKLAEWAVQYAMDCGAKEVSVSIINQTYNSIDVREQKIDKLEQAIENGMNINLYVDQKYSSHSTNRLTKNALKFFIKEAVESTKYLDADEFRKLPNPSLYYKGQEKDLKVKDNDFASIDHKNKIVLAFDIEKEILNENNKKVISATTGYYDEVYERIMLSSNGFKGDISRTFFGINANVSVKSDDVRPSDGWYESDLFYKNLKKNDIGKIALQRALRKIGQKKINSCTIPMIVENRIVNRIFSPVIKVLRARAIQQQNSFLADKLNEKVLSEKITIIDNPFIIGGRASRYFDNEGLSLKKRTIFEKGVLKNYLIDTYYGRKMNVEPNSGKTTNILFEIGNKTPETLIAEQKRAIFVTEFNGGNNNNSTGDFSYGIEGFLIENGKIVHPVSEMNITGNLLSLWSNVIEIANDPYQQSSWQSPSIAFDVVNFSGL